MQIFSVKFFLNYNGELVQDVTATLTFEVDTFADLCFASKGPKTRIPALIVFTKLYEAYFLS